MSFTETILIKSLLLDKAFLASVATAIEVAYLSSPAAADIYGTVLEYFNRYDDIPPQDIIVNEIEDVERQERARDFLNEINAIEFDVARQYEYLIDKTDEWLREKAMKQAILKSVDLIDEKDYGSIRHNIEGALGKTIKLKLGLDYFGTLRERIGRIRNFSDNRLPTYYPIFDEYLNGGFPPYTLSVIVAAIHGFKSNTLANFMARQVLAGHNIALLTLEMSEDAFAQRFDSILSCMDINKIYRGDENILKLYRKLRSISKREGLGKLYIKEFPTGEATVLDYKAYIRELGLRDVKLDAIYVDYINLMKPSYGGSRHDLYVDVKRIAEELRALGFIFNIPIISVSQLNRPGTLTDFKSVSFSYIAESMGIPATADFIAIYGVDEDKLVYENEIHYKIEKNRLGGRVGEIDQFYFDARSLKMYDSSEENLWIEEAALSHDQRRLRGTGGNGNERNNDV